MLTDAQRAAYDRDGVIVVPDVFSAAEVEELRRVTEEFVRNAARVAANDEIYDLEDSHSPAEPRVRRLKAPDLHDPAYFCASRTRVPPQGGDLGSRGLPFAGRAAGAAPEGAASARPGLFPRQPQRQG